MLFHPVSAKDLSPSQVPLKLDSTGRFVEGEVIVQYKPEIVENISVFKSVSDNANKRVHPKNVSAFDSKTIRGVQHNTLPENISVKDAVDLYLKDPNVLWAQPNFVYRLSRIPNDPRFNEQWAFHNTGQSVNGKPSGTPDADIDMPEAWDTFTGPVGSDDVVIALVDTGIDYSHPDLRDNIWTNPGEMGFDSIGRDKRSNGVDDDGSGIIDDWHGWNLVDINGDVSDIEGHGTVCGGAIGAAGDNAIGVSGVNWRVKILPVKVANAQGYATDFWIMQGMSRAYDADIKLFLLSLSSSDPADHYIGNFIRDTPDALYIVAAGNTDAWPEPNNDVTPIYPASWPYDNIISVAATDNNDNLASFSHYGVNSVDLAAPGGPYNSIVLPHNGGGYEYTQGTSISAPMVAGVAALIKSINPGANPTAIKNAIMQNVDTKSSLTGKVKSGGRLNANRALNSVAVTVLPKPDFVADVTSGVDPVTVHFTDQSTGARIQQWTWNFGDGSSSYETNPTHTYHPGSYTVTLTLSNNQGSNTSTKTNYIRVDPALPVFYIVPNFNAGGSINPSTIQSVQYGSAQTFTIVPNTGYYTEDVIASGVSQGSISSYTFTNVQANSTISATFKPAIPRANFTANTTSGIAPLTVQFNDTSIRTPTSWTWNFGDNNTSVQQNPVHTYVSAGNYTVTLTATNSAGSNTTVRATYIHVTAPIIPIPGQINAPTDPDHDGLYEDMNGNGRLDFNDLSLLFNEV